MKCWVSTPYEPLVTIGHFGKYHNTLCLSPQILQTHCFCFLLRPLKAPRETGNNAYAKSGGGANKEYYGIFRSGVLKLCYHHRLAIPACCQGRVFVLLATPSSSGNRLWAEL